MRRLVHIAVGVTMGTLTIALVAAAALLMLASAPQLFGWRSLIVISGSMEPAIPIGAVVVSRPVTPSQLRRGDIISFEQRGAPGVTVTHRLVSITHVGHRWLLQTKGDANPQPDILPVDVARPLDRVVWIFPLAGFLAVDIEAYGFGLGLIFAGVLLLLWWLWKVTETPSPASSPRRVAIAATNEPR